MTMSNTRATYTSRTLMLVALGSVLITVLVTTGALYAIGYIRTTPTTRQEQVHHMGSDVMPFDLTKTTHIFNMTETGGIQQVVAKDATDLEQIALIQQHVEHEAMQFRAGNFADPASLHGDTMPGLQALTAGAMKLAVDYAPLPNGAQITYTTNDLQLITALHQWFGAQLSDHGDDARAQE